MLAIPGALFGAEVALGDEVISEHDFAASRRSEMPIPGCVGWLVTPARCKNDSTQHAWLRLCRSTNVLCRRGWDAGRTVSRPTTARGAFERYLSFEGLDEPAARRAVGPAQLREGMPLPVWATTLGEALFAPCYDALPGVCDPKHRSRLKPFSCLLYTSISDAWRHTAPAGYGCLMPAAQQALARNLLTALSTMARDALYAEFCRYRLADFAPLAPFVSGEPDALYRRFVDQMQAGGLLALLEAYPVLGRRLAMQTDLYAATVGEFLQPARGRSARDSAGLGDSGPGPRDQSGRGLVRSASGGPPGVLRNLREWPEADLQAQGHGDRRRLQRVAGLAERGRRADRLAPLACAGPSHARVGRVRRARRPAPTRSQSRVTTSGRARCCA